MMKVLKVLVDADLIVSVLDEKSNAFEDAGTLLTDIMPFPNIHLYITDLPLEKILSCKEKVAREEVASKFREKFRDTIIPYKAHLNYFIEEQVVQPTENKRNFECEVETACAIAYGIDAVVTHKKEDFAGSDLLVWSVTELSAVVLRKFVAQLEILFAKSPSIETLSFNTSPPLPKTISSSETLETISLGADDQRRGRRGVPQKIGVPQKKSPLSSLSLKKKVRCLHKISTIPTNDNAVFIKSLQFPLQNQTYPLTLATAGRKT
ncbi:hypothetical protein [Scytonema sp. PCC 10023]|uniref:hypothetical protein n=1 Tax=Scytonema sp. PCC 10023 TaxID=1680591 RepID=UPI0039C6B8DE